MESVKVVASAWNVNTTRMVSTVRNAGHITTDRKVFQLHHVMPAGVSNTFIISVIVQTTCHPSSSSIMSGKSSGSHRVSLLSPSYLLLLDVLIR